MKEYRIKYEARSDYGSEELGELLVTENTEYAGALEIWGFSMFRWELDVFHKPTGVVVKNNNQKLRDGSEVSAIDAWVSAQPMKKIKDITEKDVRACGPLGFRKKLVRDGRFSEKEVDDMTNEQLSELTPICDNLSYREWTVTGAESDSSFEYDWWFDRYKLAILEYAVEGILEEDNDTIKKYRHSDAYRLIREGKEPIPLLFEEVSGLDNARWVYSTPIEQLADMKHPLTKEEWVENVLMLHNEIVDTLSLEWERVKQFQ